TWLVAELERVLGELEALLPVIK
ncbi:MAG: hypothetical protein JWP55_784, partial [Mycobacterium sp.]|nr:hypothetical protein [Mycobacterium sp.]